MRKALPPITAGVSPGIGLIRRVRLIFKYGNPEKFRKTPAHTGAEIMKNRKKRLFFKKNEENSEKGLAKVKNGDILGNVSRLRANLKP